MQERQPDEFGALLKRLRLEAKLSQEQLAERARISVEAVGSYERGSRRAPHRDTLALLVEALAVTGAARDELVFAADQARVRGPVVTERDKAAPKSNNLPLARTAFVGREREMAEVKELLTRYRLLTLVGSGGVGKTRVAIQVGAELLADYRDGVWFVDLASIGDPTLVASVVTQALGVAQSQGVNVDDSILLWLRRRQLLLILDNCEHVVETAAALADKILTAAPDVRILATSRQSLNLSGEGIHRLPSLTLPEDSAALETGAALHYDAVALFVDRAKAADSGFALTGENAPIIAGICRRLDGIALAIELAAARVKVVSIPHLAQHLNERFDILTGGNRTALPRQQTLAALIDWSYNLLSEKERSLCARLGIFAGGFDLEAAIAVCGGDGLHEREIFDLVASLADKSLVIADTNRKRERYRMLESTAAYAFEKLGASGEAEALARRHAE
ncbi:MAG: helix-turn-helix domain-containing protein, partial [Candidatus Eremiobacteraeota bacterium]|nr:helix-turn-helix domain-containing protein [Candidatus Eremiobacteraeota bacterium]